MIGNGGRDSLDGRAGNDRLDGGAGNDALSGLQDDDIYIGGSGRDTFIFRSYFSDFSDGKDVIADFERGTDIVLWYHIDAEDQHNYIEMFSFLDSNRNGTLDESDDFVEVEQVTFEGQTKLSTVIDHNAVVTGAASGDSITFFGVTGLTVDDFTGWPV